MTTFTVRRTDPATCSHPLGPKTDDHEAGQFADGDEVTGLTLQQVKPFLRAHAPDEDTGVWETGAGWEVTEDSQDTSKPRKTHPKGTRGNPITPPAPEPDPEEG